MTTSRHRPPGRSAARGASPLSDASSEPAAALTTGPADAVGLARVARDAAERTELDVAQLNLAYLHVARELSRSARDEAITRLGLDAEACAALDRLSVDDLHALAHSRGLLFMLRLDAGALIETARLARADRAAFEARLLLSSPRP